MKSFEVISVLDLLLRYLQQGRIQVDPTRHPELTTYHDPCHYGRKSLKTFGHGYFEEGRWITRRCSPHFIEMYPNREGNYCCGAGGGVLATAFKEERVFHGRFKARQIERTRAKVVVAPCQNCRDQIQKSLCREFDLDVEVKSLRQLVAESLVLPKGTVSPGKLG